MRAADLEKHLETEKAPWISLRLSSNRDTPKLLGFLLLLLTDADFEAFSFIVLERLVVVPSNGLQQVLIHIGVLRQNRHQRKTIVASGTERPEPFYIRDRHNRI